MKKYINDFVLVPKPIITVTIESITNAHTKEPPLINPVT